MTDLPGKQKITYDRVSVEKYLESDGNVDGQKVKPVNHERYFAPIYKSEAQSNIKQTAEDARARFSY